MSPPSTRQEPLSVSLFVPSLSALSFVQELLFHENIIELVSIEPVTLGIVTTSKIQSYGCEDIS